jgi:predicted membrane-bound mannosyltransferase
MLLPLALLAGILVRDLLAARRTRLLAPPILGAAVLLSAYQALDLNFTHYDDETYPYVFVHTTRQTLALVDEIETDARQAGTGADTGIALFTPEYWPLPWYLRDYPGVGYHGQIVETMEPIVVARTDQEAELPPEFTDAYRRAGEYTLRPGVQLALYLRRETFGP